MRLRVQEAGKQHLCSCDGLAPGITQPVIQPDGATVFCPGESVTLASTPGESYLWTTGGTSQELTVTQSGNYSVNVTEGNCNATSVPIPVIVNPKPVLTAASLSFCPGDSVLLTTSPGDSYLWSTGETTPSIKAHIAGTYTVTVSNGTCLAESLPVTLTYKTPVPFPVITASALSMCSGGTVLLTSSVTAQNQWYTGQTGQNIIVSNPGTYTVSRSHNGCTLVSEPVTITAVPGTIAQPVITLSGPASLCEGESVTLNASESTGIVWSTGETVQSIAVSTSGNYFVTVSDETCSAVSAITLVTVNPLPPVPQIQVSANPACGSASLYNDAPYAKLWSTGQATQNITVMNSGTYSLTITTTAGCSVSSVPVEMIVNPLPPTPVITAEGPLVFCQGESVVLTSSEDTENLWSTGENTQSTTAETTGFYTVSVSDGTCSSTSQAVWVQVNQYPEVPVISAVPSLCGGMVLTSSVASGLQWSNGETDNPITVYASGEYSVTATYYAPGCSRTSEPIMVEIEQPEISVGGPLVFCEGETVTLTSSSATGNLWSTGETTQTIVVADAGNYTVAVTQDGCTDPILSTSVSVTVNSVPYAPLITVDGTVLTSSATTGNQWYLDGLSINGATGQTHTATSSGVYTVSVSNTYHCTSHSEGVFIQSDLSIDELSVGYELVIMPNPSSGEFRLKTDLKPQRIIICNLLGEIVYESAYQEETDISHLSAGSYSILVLTAHGIYRKPLIRK